MYLAVSGAIQVGVGLKSFSVASSMAATGPCEASTADEVRSCIENIRSGTANAIHIRAMISCSAANECNFPLNGLPSATSASSISIYGDGDGLTGFKRTDHYDYSIFVVPYSKRIKFIGLTFDDTAVEVSGPYSPISLYYATDI